MYVINIFPQLSFVGQEAESIPGIIGSKYGKVVTRLDLSSNQLRLEHVIYRFSQV